jgi:hypothetical protein
VSAAVSTSLVRSRPILFSGAMVRAILAGTKTQTRRLFFSTPSPCAVGPTVYGRGYPKSLHPYEGDISDSGLPCAPSKVSGCLVDIPCPFGTAGDRLWVRETHGYLTGNGVRVVYRADGDEPKAIGSDRRVPGMKWKPSIFLRRHESRITLEITGTRCERLQSITDDDICAEGVDEAAVEALGGKPVALGTSLRDLWQLGWDAINCEKAPFRFDPFVWVVSFRRLP